MRSEDDIGSRARLRVVSRLLRRCPFVLPTLLLGLSCAAWTGCRNHNKATAPSTDGSSPADGGAMTANSCGGHVEASGTTPYGSFAVSDVYVTLVEYNCPRRVQILLRGPSMGGRLVTQQLDIGFQVDRAAGKEGLVGRFSTTAIFSQPNQPTITTTVDVEITGADDPFPSGVLDAAVTGAMAGTFALTTDGFSVNGSFGSPYCNASACSTP